MPRFSAPEKQGRKQAGAVMRRLQGHILTSVGTVRNYEAALQRVATTLAYQQQDLKALTPTTAQAYLAQRAEQVSQATLDMERQALQVMMQHVTHQLPADQRLPVVQSEHETVLKARAYTPAQVQAIAAHQAPHNALATHIAHAAGLRAHELYTLAPAETRPADDRPALAEKFAYRDGRRYTVIGKGGLCREVQLPSALADQLEARRLAQPVTVTDRGIHYEPHYALGAGWAFSRSVSRVARRVLGFSNGAHGLRHSYAQERMDELRDRGTERTQALTVVSQEMGHFRPAITEVYLR